jgi:hypothetical protein
MIDSEFLRRACEAFGPMDRKHQLEAVPVVHCDIKACTLQKCKRHWLKPKLPFGFAEPK